MPTSHPNVKGIDYSEDADASKAKEDGRGLPECARRMFSAEAGAYNKWAQAKLLFFLFNL
jgi:hypothetical protein